MMNLSKVSKITCLGFALAGIIGLTGCGGDDNNNNLPKVNKENCTSIGIGDGKMKIYASDNDEAYKKLGLDTADAKDKEIYALKCEIFMSEELKKNFDKNPNVQVFIQGASEKDRNEFKKQYFAEIDQKTNGYKEELKKLEEEKNAKK